MSLLSYPRVQAVGTDGGGSGKPQQLAIGLAVAGAVCLVLGLAARLGEFAVVFGLFLLFLAGGVLNWDRRTGH